MTTNPFKPFVLGLFVFSSLLTAIAQQSVVFNEGLIAAPCHRYGRQGIYTDELAWQMYTNVLQKPGEGKTLFVNQKGDSIKWKSIKAGENGRFYDEGTFGAYLYLTYLSAKDQDVMLNITGNSMVFFNGEPHSGDVYESKWLYIPVKIKKGLNELYLRVGYFYNVGVTARLIFPEKQVMLNTEDPTLPFAVTGEDNSQLLGAIVVINCTDRYLNNLSVKSSTEKREKVTALPTVPPTSTRKVPFIIDASDCTQKSSYTGKVILLQKGVELDRKNLTVEAVNQDDHYSRTFISEIDNSVQYYAVCPQSGNNGNNGALFLSVHGAGVEAIGQARAYRPKDWGTLVAPTNRRPRGFNWEDWGRIDALEVLKIAKDLYKPDPEHIYLTGHSMGGHGTWYLGATYPGKWAAIAPCAAYPTLFAYASADGKIPENGRNKNEDMLLRASNGSNVLELSRNYGASGIYIHHGDSDKVVSVEYARQMRKVLGEFHKDFSYYEYPGGSHWFGSESVDWPPLFDYFKWHKIQHDSAVNNIDFSTANPAISSSYYWLTILQQQESLKYSRINISRSIELKSITGETENVSALALDLSRFSLGDTITIKLDGAENKITITRPEQMLYLYNNEKWVPGEKPSDNHKGIVRNGTFKEPFNNRMVFVYGTTGTAEENKWAYNKARYDAETWYYRGNGAVDMIADVDFEPGHFADRGIVLFGNAETNKAWNKLLVNCPILVKRGVLMLGGQKFTGDDLGAYFMWPRPDSKIASVAVITGTGLTGMNATNANQYFSGGSGFPDYMVFTKDLLKSGIEGIKAAGFYTNDWKLLEEE